MNQNFNIYLGPHILQNSFQVELDVKNKLQPNSDQFYEKDDKFYIDLKSILIQQIQSVANFKLNSVEFDTQSDLRFNSFRRDKEKSGRNLSFIVKTNA